MMGNIDICETCRLHSSPCLTDDKEIPFADELCSSICFRERASSHIFVLCSLTTCDAARRRTLSKTSFTFPLSSMHSTHHSPHPRTPQKQGCHTPERSSSRTRRKDARDHTSLHERKRSTPALVEKRASHVSCTFDRISNCKAVSPCRTSAAKTNQSLSLRLLGSSCNKASSESYPCRSEIRSIHQLP